MITSTSNAGVKALAQLMKKGKARREQGLFVTEGVRGFREVPSDRIERIYVSESFLSQPESRVFLSEYEYEVLDDRVFAHVSDTATPQGILCVVRMKEYGPDEIFSEGDGLWIILEHIQDPGNLGTMFRTGEGAGVSGIIMDGTTVDVYSPKVIRSTMGSIFRVPFMVTDDLTQMVEELKSQGVRIYAAAAGGDLSYSEADCTGGTAFLIGNEGNGLSAGMLALANERISIPMRGQLESLNVSMAAGILMYEADRQRRAG